MLSRFMRQRCVCGGVTRRLKCMWDRRRAHYRGRLGCRSARIGRPRFTALTSSAIICAVETTINLAPADHARKASFDLAIALAWLMAMNRLRRTRGAVPWWGNWHLTGQLRRVKGVLPIALTARAEGRRDCSCPQIMHPKPPWWRGWK